MKYNIKAYYEMCGNIEVEADSLKEAIDKVMEGGLPPVSDYVDDSFEIDMEVLKDRYPEEMKECQDI